MGKIHLGTFASDHHYGEPAGEDHAFSPDLTWSTTSGSVPMLRLTMRLAFAC